MKKIFINPGHCPDIDPGAVNKDYGVCEAVVVRDIGQMLYDILNGWGYNVRLEQSDNLVGEDEYAYRESICAKANRWKPDIFISLHCNAAGSREVNGTECWVYSKGNNISTRLAEAFQEKLCKLLFTEDRGVKENEEFVVLKYTNMPAMLVELAFITNTSDVLNLLDRQTEVAEVLAEAIRDVLEAEEE